MNPHAIVQAQQLRLARINIATAVYVVCWLLLVIFQQLNVVKLMPSVISMLGIALVLIALAFRYAVQCDFNRRLTDPSMTMAQLTVASLWSFIPIYFNPALRAEMLMVHVSMYFFGCFRLKRRQFILVSLVPISCYLLVILADLRFHANVNVQQEIFRFILFIATMAIISFVGGYIYDVRRSLRAKQQELIKANEKISQQASHDALTGMYNRRYLIDAMAREEARAKRRGGRFSVIICDLDHFKLVNDRFGHLVGDQVLQRCAHTIAQRLRQEDSMGRPETNLPVMDDMVSRYGGEEFVLLLPDTDSEGAQICADRLRAAIAELSWLNIADDLRVTASFGAATFRPGDVSKDVLARADSALYDAKHAGRNRVVVAQ
jgi:GGDEF domain-containing protein